jgi:hypothetical protein
LFRKEFAAFLPDILAIGESALVPVLPEIAEDRAFPIRKRLTALFPIFAATFREKPPERELNRASYCSFLSHLICDILKVATSNYREFAKVLSMLENCAVDCLKLGLMKYLTQMHETQLASSFLILLNGLLTYSIARSPDHTHDDKLADSLFTFCLFDGSRFLVFLSFWFLVFRSLSPGDKIRILEVFRLQFDRLPLKDFADYHPFLYILLSAGTSPLNSFAASLWSHLLECLNAFSESARTPEIAQLLSYPTYEAFAGMSEEDNRKMCEFFFVEFTRKAMQPCPRPRHRSDVSARFPDRVLSSLFTFAYKNAITFMTTMKRFLQQINLQDRRAESSYAVFLCNKVRNHSQSQTSACLKQTTKSFRSTSFHAATDCPVQILPSPFPVSELTSQTVSTEFSLMGLEGHPCFRPPVVPPGLEPLFALARYFDVGDMASCIGQSFGEEFQFGNCRVIRRMIDVPCAFALSQTRILLLSDAVYRDNDIFLTPLSKSALFLQSTFLNEFGGYHLFCGHPNLVLDFSSVFFAAASKSSVALNSHTLGSCVITFETVIPPQIPLTNLVQMKTQAVRDWCDGKMSNAEFLIIVNLVAGRSFDDLTAYPIFPRVLQSFSLASFAEEMGAMRDLATPLPVLADRDKSHENLERRMEVQGFHHSENLSSPVSVSTFLVRLIPFLNYQWFFHSGFDLVDRMFTSIPTQFGVSPTSLVEFSPECFTLPETFINLNSISLENGDPLELEFPAWSRNAFEFVEKHRYALECEAVRNGLAIWVDLVFGCRQRGPEAVKAFNMFNPMGYGQRERLSSDEREFRAKWVSGCGQIPEKVFEGALPRPQPVAAAPEILFELNRNYPTDLFLLDTKRGFIQGVLTHQDDTFCAAVNLAVSTRSQFVAVTFAISRVVVFRVLFADGAPSKLARHSTLMRNSVVFSVVNDRALICATVSLTEIVLWSIGSGSILGIIGQSDVNGVAFDDDMHTLYFGAENTLFQSSLTGRLIRKKDLGKKIGAIAVYALGFCFTQRCVLVGTVDGTLMVVAVDLASGDFVVTREVKMSDFPIVRIFVRTDYSGVDVFDAVCPRLLCM